MSFTVPFWPDWLASLLCGWFWRGWQGTGTQLCMLCVCKFTHWAISPAPALEIKIFRIYPQILFKFKFYFYLLFPFLISGDQSPLLAYSIRTGINKDSTYLRRGCSQICAGVKWQDLQRFGDSFWICGCMGTLVMGTNLKRWWETLRSIFALWK